MSWKAVTSRRSVESMRMGFLERLFGGTPQKKEIVTEKLGLGEALERTKGMRDERLKPFLQEAKSEITESLQLLPRIRALATEFANKPLVVENPQHERIAKQMKENYFARIPKTFEGIHEPERYDFEEIRDFQREVSHALLNITKITADNRYLLFFFKTDFEALGEPLTALAKKMEALGKQLLEQSKVVEAEKGLENGYKEIMQLEEKIKESKASIQKNEQEFKSMQNAADAGAEEGARKKLEEAEGEMQRLKGEMQHVKGEVASFVLPLERLFRKYERMSLEPKKAKAAEEFLQDHFGALLQEGGVAKLKALCKELEGMLLQNKLQEGEKDRRKHLELLKGILEGRVIGALMKDYKSLEETLGKEEESKRVATEGVNEFEGKGKAIAGKRAEMEKLKKELGESEALRVKLLGELDGKLLEFSGGRMGLKLE